MIIKDKNTTVHVPRFRRILSQWGRKEARSRQDTGNGSEVMACGPGGDM